MVIKTGVITANRLRCYNELSDKEKKIFNLRMINLIKLMNDEINYIKKPWYKKIVDKLRLKNDR